MYLTWIGLKIPWNVPKMCRAKIFTYRCYFGILIFNKINVETYMKNP